MAANAFRGYYYVREGSAVVDVVNLAQREMFSLFRQFTSGGESSLRMQTYIR